MYAFLVAPLCVATPQDACNLAHRLRCQIIASPFYKSGAGRAARIPRHHAVHKLPNCTDDE
eukprot:1640170-Pyramimonas_sp.AAC.1